MLNDSSVSSEEKAAASERAAKYYTLAWESTQSQRGRLIVMAGLSGSGKSTTARYLSRQLGAIQIRSDAVRKHLGGIELDQRGDDSLYTPDMTQKTYRRLLDLGLKLANEGYTVILDAKYDRTALRQGAIAQATNAQLPISIVHCDAPMAVRQERLRQRSGDIADATAELLPKQVFEIFTTAELPHVITVDTTQAVDAQLEPHLAQWKSS